MANQRYYLYCPCGNHCYIGKSFGYRVTSWSDNDASFLAKIYDWMWEHTMDCERTDRDELPEEPDYISREWAERGTLFEVLTEGDPRIK